jgi:hypothetical protein
VITPHRLIVVYRRNVYLKHTLFKLSMHVSLGNSDDQYRHVTVSTEPEVVLFDISQCRPPVRMHESTVYCTSSWPRPFKFDHLCQVCSNLYVMRPTSTKFGMQAGKMKFNIKNEE